MLLGAMGLAAASCGGADPIAPLPVSAQVSLAPGAFTILRDSAVSGAMVFPSAPAAGAGYLVVGQLATGTAGVSSPFTLGGQAFGADLVLPQLARRTPPALVFHDRLRARESELARLGALRAPLFRAPPVRTPPPPVGTKRTFKVCANLDCTTTRNVAATVQYAGVHAAIFVDDSAPAGGFTGSDLAQIGTQFDQELYVIDTDRFGAESDIDGNGVVLVLLTKQINALVPKPDCNTSFVTGFFFGADIAPGFAAQYNNGEVFYGMVPDPAGSATLCAYSTSFVKRVIQVTFIHEFQHMISFNQHVLLRGGQDETLWLNEALSHLAEELGGLHYDSLNVDSTATRFFIGDFFNAYTFLRDPAATALVTETSPGSLAERGAAWLFVRYLVDRFGETVSRSLVQTGLTGAANVQAVTGQSLGDLLGPWALALYATDLPGFTAPPELRFTRWSFRTTFGSLHNQDPADFPLPYPLTPDSGLGGLASTAGTMRSGGSAFLRLTQLPSAQGFQLVFRGGNGGALPAGGRAQLAAVRLH